MASELLLVNPRRRRRARKMSALQRQYFGGGRRKRRSSLRVSAVSRNPRRRSRRRVSRLRRNPRFARARAYVARRRSGGGSSFGFGHILNDVLIPSAIGAGGALALDLAWGMLPLPASLTTGTLAPITRVAGAVAVGVVVGMIFGKRWGAWATVGSVTVTLADLFKSSIAANFPALHLGDGMGVYVGRGNVHPYAGRLQGMDGMDGMDYYTPAQQVGVGSMDGVGVYVP